jgi:hypothetical protein
VTLDQVVLCAVGERGDGGFLVLEVGQDDDRHGRRRRLHPMQVLDAGPIGQVEVEQHDAVGALGKPVEAGKQPLNVIDFDVRPGEARDLVTNESGLDAVILDQEDADGFLAHSSLRRSSYAALLTSDGARGSST